MGYFNRRRTEILQIKRTGTEPIRKMNGISPFTQTKIKLIVEWCTAGEVAV